MNKMILTATAILISQSSLAATLNCWKTNFHPKKPFMTAKILSNSRLANVVFNYKDITEVLVDTNATVNGNEITSNHSPYKGNVEYDLAGSLTLILPADLSNESLVRAEKKGLGYYKNENGIVIGSSGESEGGNHISWRMSCRSNK